MPTAIVSNDGVRMFSVYGSGFHSIRRCLDFTLFIVFTRPNLIAHFTSIIIRHSPPSDSHYNSSPHTSSTATTTYVCSPSLPHSSLHTDSPSLFYTPYPLQLLIPHKSNLHHHQHMTAFCHITHFTRITLLCSSPHNPYDPSTTLVHLHLYIC